MKRCVAAVALAAVCQASVAAAGGPIVASPPPPAAPGVDPSAALVFGAVAEVHELEHEKAADIVTKSQHDPYAYAAQAEAPAGKLVKPGAAAAAAFSKLGVEGAEQADYARAKQGGGKFADGVSRASVHESNVEVMAAAPQGYQHMLIRILSTVQRMAGRPVFHFVSLTGRYLEYDVVAGDRTHVAMALGSLVPSLGIELRDGRTLVLPALPAGEDKPAGGEDKPAGGEDKPAADEDKPAAGEDKPAAGEDKPAAGEDKPAAGAEDEPAAAESSAGEDDSTGADDDAPVVDLGDKADAREFLNAVGNPLASNEPGKAAKEAAAKAAKTDDLTPELVEQINERQLLRLGPEARGVLRSMLSALKNAGIRVQLHDAALGGSAAFYRVLEGSAESVQAVGVALGVAASGTVLRAPAPAPKPEGAGRDPVLEAAGLGADAGALPANTGEETTVKAGSPAAGAEAEADFKRDNDETAKTDSPTVEMTPDEADALREANDAQVSELAAEFRPALAALLNNLVPHGVVVRLSGATAGGKLVTYRLLSGSRTALVAAAEANGVVATDTDLKPKGAVVVEAEDVADLERRETAEDADTLRSDGKVTAEAVDEDGNPVTDAAPGADQQQTCAVWALAGECPERTVRNSNSDSLPCATDDECVAACCGSVYAKQRVDEDALIEAHRAKLAAAAAAKASSAVAPAAAPPSGGAWDPRAHLLGRGQ